MKPPIVPQTQYPTEEQPSFPVWVRFQYDARPHHIICLLVRKAFVIHMAVTVGEINLEVTVHRFTNSLNDLCIIHESGTATGSIG